MLKVNKNDFTIDTRVRLVKVVDMTNKKDLYIANSN